MKSRIILAVMLIAIGGLSGCVVYDPPRDARYSNRDRDRDGVPNRVDRDRDGDGVPNRYDNRPSNPSRY